MIEKLRVDPNIDELGDILSIIKGLEADQVATSTMPDKPPAAVARAVREVRKCFICGSEKHLARYCDSPCNVCGDIGHKHGQCKKSSDQSHSRDHARHYLH